MLSAEEIQKGQMVTVLQWEPLESNDFLGNTATVTDRSFVGDEMEVLAVQLPFVKCGRKSSLIPVVTIDTRRCHLMELDKDFISVNTEVSHEVRHERS